MGKTADLRKLIQAELTQTPGAVYYKRMPITEQYPYKVYDLHSVNYDDARDDIYLDVDIWANAEDQTIAEDIADQIEAQLDTVNLPQKNIFPTFYRDTRANVDDPNKKIQHIRLTFLVQMYADKGAK